MQISFVIVTWNCLEQIKKCLASLTALQIPDSEVIVVDASSHDGTAEYLETVKNIRLHLMFHKHSWSFNNDFGIAMAKGDWICVMNPDIYFNSSFNNVLDVLRASTTPYPIVSPQLVYPDGTDQQDVVVLTFARLLKHFTLIGAYANRLIRSHSMIEKAYPGQGLRADTITLWHESGHLVRLLLWKHPRGSMFIIHRNTIAGFGGPLWRRGMRLMAADSDLFRQAFEKQIPILLVPSARIVHEEGHVTKRQYPPIIDRESSYGFILFARYWNEHPFLLSILYVADTIFLFVVSPVRRRLFGIQTSEKTRLSPSRYVSIYRHRAAAKILGVIDAWQVKLEK